MGSDVGPGFQPAAGLLPGVLLVIALGALASGQRVFPSETQDPKQAGGAELLDAVCPGRTAGSMTCRGACPKFTGFAGDLGWSLEKVTRGHFLSPTSEDAVLWMSGCEPHAANWGGSMLLTKRSNRWLTLWYKAGVETSQCHKVPLTTGREILVCMGTYGAQGATWTALYVEDLLKPTPVLMSSENREFFSVFDNTVTCGWSFENASKPDPLTRAYIEKVEFKTGDESGPLSLSVTARFGKRPMKPEDVKACMEELNRKGYNGPSRFLPSAKRYHIDFVFDGHDYKVVPASAPAARVFGSE